MQRGSRYRLRGYGDLKCRSPVRCGNHGCHDRLGITQPGVAFAKAMGFLVRV
jgi:hypothetical protein